MAVRLKERIRALRKKHLTEIVPQPTWVAGQSATAPGTGYRCPTCGPCRIEGCDAWQVLQILAETQMALRAWVQTYANVQPDGRPAELTPDQMEVQLFHDWLWGARALDIKARRVGALSQALQDGE